LSALPLPRLWMVFTFVGLSAFALALGGMLLVRVYDDQLIRQTEAELISQGVAVAEVFAAHLRAERGGVPYGTPRTAAWPFPVPPDSHLRPILPSLRASDPPLPAVGDPPPSPVPADARAERAGALTAPLLTRLTRATLSGIRVVDTHGVVVATSGGGLGASVYERPEVQRALAGAPQSVLRRRETDNGGAQLASLSRETALRVSVVLPVLDGDTVLGAVVLSRTPMTLSKAVYQDRWNLTAVVAVLLLAVALTAIFAAALVVRPVRALVRQTRAIAAGEHEGLAPVERPVFAELAELSVAQARMAAALRHRNEYIRNFAANVSHEFKTPLSAIQGAIELLRADAGEMTPEQRERFLANIDRDARRLTRLVERLLELARADAAELGAAGEVDVGALLAAVAERAGREGLSLEVRAPASGPWGRAPAEVLDAVVWQLVTNARQHAGPAARVVLTAEQDGAQVRVRVADDGPGISPANWPRVFDPFFTTARDRGGTGMGLPIARALLRAFGGELALEPADTGAWFAIRLPVQRR
jgi:two-component system sensor histidine kinase CreC